MVLTLIRSRRSRVCVTRDATRGRYCGSAPRRSSFSGIVSHVLQVREIFGRLANERSPDGLPTIDIHSL
jgi:hypothetical protein